MKVLALDIGEKRVGIATGDTEAKIAIPISTISAAELMAGGPAFRRLLEDHEPELLVVGLPLSLDGGEHQQARRVRQAAERIGEMCGLPVVYQDERLSSAEARRSLRETGWTEREMRGKIDMVAASLILRAYLDATYLSEQGSSGQ
jgi:putative Holliday junction resolvase